MPQASTYFLISAAIFGIGLLFSGVSMLLSAKKDSTEASPSIKLVFYAGNFIMLLSVGIFSMALYLLLKGTFSW